MPRLLTLRGRNALSPFRVAKLEGALAKSLPDHGIAGVAATWWHFVEVARPLAAGEEAVLERILTYGPQDDGADPAGGLLLVVPRPGTISPWSTRSASCASYDRTPAVRSASAHSASELGANSRMSSNRPSPSSSAEAARSHASRCARWKKGTSMPR
jgi:hypothetical protein